MKSMKNPPHPGEVFRRTYMEPMELSVTQTASYLRVSRQHLSELVHGKRPFSFVLAQKVGAMTQTSTKSWLNMQNSYDLWEHRNDRIDVKPYPYVESAIA